MLNAVIKNTYIQISTKKEKSMAFIRAKKIIKTFPKNTALNKIERYFSFRLNSVLNDKI